MFQGRVHASPPIREISVYAQIDKPEEKWWAIKNLSKKIERKLRTNGITKTVVENLDPSTLNALLKELDIPVDVRCTLLLKDDAIQEQEIVNEKEMKLLNGWVGNGKELCYWVKAMAICILTTVIPTLSVGLLHFYGYDAPPEWVTNDLESNKQEILQYQLSRVILPALAILLIVFFLTPRFALFFVSKLYDNRSKGVEVKKMMESLLTNSGVVAALLLTVVFAALLADLPVEDNPSSYLNMFYSMFLLMAIFYSFTATIMSSICYLYMQPLHDAALKTFMSEMALYYGEPMAATVLTMWLLLNAIILWLWGQYGATVGISAILICYFFCVRVLVCIQNLHGWENPYQPRQNAPERRPSSSSLTVAQTDHDEISKGGRSFRRNKSFRRNEVDNKSCYEDDIAKLEDDIEVHEKKIEKTLRKKQKSQSQIQESKSLYDPNMTCGMFGVGN